MAGYDHTGRAFVTLWDLEAEGKEDIDGWTIWKGVAESLSLDPKQYKCQAYEKMKDSLTDLERLGYVSSLGTTRAVAKRKWTITDKGEAWWQSEGMALHGPRRDEAGQDVLGQYMGKWVAGQEIPAAVWEMLGRRARKGEIKLYIKPATNKS